MADSLPPGTVVFLFTDIEGSTTLAQQYRTDWERLRARHHALLHSVFGTHHGYVFEIVGDALCVAFHRPIDALLAAIEAQRVLLVESWDPAPLRVRMGIHAGPAEVAGTGYRGYITLTSTQRLMSAAHGGQIVLSQSAFDLAGGMRPISRVRILA